MEATYYLDTYFNLGRRHSALGYRSPHQVETDLITLEEPAAKGGAAPRTKLKLTS